jgi:acetyltransferase-like isoleucine patch superfamily enzyme
MGTLIRAGVRVGKNSVIGMGSLVVRDVPSNSVVFGVPAKGKRGYTRSVYEKKKIDYERKLIGASI